MLDLDRLRAGDLRDRLTIQTPSFAPDGAGGRTATWTTIATTWAEVQPINGGEPFRAGLVNSTQFYRIRFGFRSDVTPKCRLVLENGVVLNIRTCADPNRDREQLLITAESGVPDS